MDNESCAPSSLSIIVTVPLLSRIVAPDAELSSTVNVSRSSATLSSSTVTLMVSFVLPARNVSVPSLAS